MSSFSELLIVDAVVQGPGTTPLPTPITTEAFLLHLLPVVEAPGAELIQALPKVTPPQGWVHIQ